MSDCLDRGACVRFHATEAHSPVPVDRKSTRLNSSHSQISYAVFCLKKKPPCRRHLSDMSRRWTLPDQRKEALKRRARPLCHYFNVATARVARKPSYA